MRNINKHLNVFQSNAFLPCLVLIVLFSIVFAFITPQFVHAQATTVPAAPSNPGGTSGSTGGAGAGNGSTSPGAGQSKGETCTVEKIGWIVCPLMEGAAKASDAAFNILAGRFLEVEPELLANNGKGTQLAWEQARNLANVMFILAFIIIVYSQVTGAGLNNYGIKRMLPRLIIAAIAVNVSFYICQGMVDLSNLLGYNIKDGLSNISKAVGPNVFSPSPSSNFNSGGGVLTAIAVIGLASAAVWIFVMLGAGVILTILIIVVSVILILLMRKAILVLLVVISPIAIVMYLLPNTERLFNKWLSMFWKLLMVFPVVALLFGGGQLASAIVLSAGTSQATPQSNATAANNNCNVDDQLKQNSQDKDSLGYDNIVPCADNITLENGKPASIGLGLIATGIAIAPLLAVWSVLQGALSAAGAIGGKIGGAIQKGSQKGIGGAGAWASKNTSVGRGLAARKAIKQNYKDEKFAGRMSASGRRGALTRTMARGVGGNAGLAASKISGKLDGRAGTAFGAMTGGLQAQNAKLSSNFAGAAAKIQKQEVEDGKALLYGKGIGDLSTALENAIKRGDEAGAKAAQEMLTQAGEAGGQALAAVIRNTEPTYGQSSAMNAMKTHITQNQSSMKGSRADIYGWASDDNGRQLSNVQQDQSIYNKLTNEQLASQQNESLGFAASSGALSKEQTIVKEDGSKVQVNRATAILRSKSAENIKGTNATILNNSSNGPTIP